MRRPRWMQPARARVSGTSRCRCWFPSAVLMVLRPDPDDWRRPASSSRNIYRWAFNSRHLVASAAAVFFGLATGHLAGGGLWPGAAPAGAVMTARLWRDPRRLLTVLGLTALPIYPSVDGVGHRWSCKPTPFPVQGASTKQLKALVASWSVLAQSAARRAPAMNGQWRWAAPATSTVGRRPSWSFSRA